jgi:BirA family biotin operon repressor/biotin-[acetyl-CoA-carboxylase] ligase
MAASLAPHGLIRPALLDLLADGRLHSGAALAGALGVTRAAVWKGVARLRAQGVGVEAVARRGYRLPEPVDLLDERRMRAQLDPARSHRLHSLEVLYAVDSTNTRLLGAAPPPFGTAAVCVSELQTAGRGRRGRRWIAPFGASLALSLAWTFRDVARDMASLSLCAGVAVVRALARLGACGVMLKWPNDVLFEGNKLAGILVELRAEAAGPAHVVIGIGLNVALSPAARREIAAGGGRTDVAAAADACRESPSRNRLAGVLIDEVLGVIAEFETAGFDAMHSAWAAHDALKGRTVNVALGESQVVGQACGIDRDGGLWVEVGGVRRKFVAGEVSLRHDEIPA